MMEAARWTSSSQEGALGHSSAAALRPGPRLATHVAVIVGRRQEQSLGRRRVPGVQAMHGLEDPLHRFDRPRPPADVDPERPDDRTDHVVEEAVGLDLQADERFVRRLPPFPPPGRQQSLWKEQVVLPDPADGDVVDRPDAGGLVGPVRFEAAEVVRPDQDLRRAVHVRNVEPVAKPPRRAAPETGCRPGC